MPVEGGKPKRITFGARGSTVHGWTPDGRVLVSTWHLSTLPDKKMIRVNPESAQYDVIPLSQAADGAYDTDGKSFFFARLRQMSSKAKRYKGGGPLNRSGASTVRARKLFPSRSTIQEQISGRCIGTRVSISRQIGTGR
jgi:tricorn protease-like protein